MGELPAEPVRARYRFAGWYTAPGGNGTHITADSTVVGNMTVYANWEFINPQFINLNNIDIGDIVLENGKYINFSDYKINAEGYMSISKPVGVVAYKGKTDSYGITGKVYMIGLQHDTCRWAPSGSTGEKTKFNTSLTNGGENWGVISAADVIGTADASTYYPAFNFANTYRAIGYTDGWFLPARGELSQICQNKVAINATISAIIDAGGIATQLPNGYSWSSSQNEYEKYEAFAVTFGASKSLEKYFTAFIIVARALDD